MQSVCGTTGPAVVNCQERSRNGRKMEGKIVNCQERSRNGRKMEGKIVNCQERSRNGKKMEQRWRESRT